LRAYVPRGCRKPSFPRLRRCVKSLLGSKLRLTALDCFEEQRKTFCAAAWIENKTGIAWNWSYDLTPAQLDAALKKQKGKLITIRAYMTTLAGQLASPQIRYCAVWVKDDGEPWAWIPDADADSISDTLDAKSARLISIDNLDNTVWLGDAERFCAVWYQIVSGDTWFWNIGLGIVDLPKEPPKFCSWPLDVSHCMKDRFVSIMQQYPKPADVALANLITFSGSGQGNLRDDLWTEIQWSDEEQNLVAEAVKLESAFMFSAAEGGWSWWSGNFVTPSGQTVLGLPLALDPSQTYDSTPFWVVSNNPKVGVFPIKATASGGKHQYLMAQTVISHPGFASPSPLSIQWPIFLGLQAPVEAVKLTNGTVWVTLAGQIVNGTGARLDVTNVSVKLKNQSGTTIHKAYFTNALTIDQDVLGKAVSPAQTGSVSGSDAPLPKFYDGFAVPRAFKKGKLKVQSNVKFQAGELDCYGDERVLDVGLAPVTVMTRLPYDVPAIGGLPNPAFRWRWGNGIGGTSFNARSYPEHRYSYDVGVIDPNGQTFADPAKKDQNENYYCWGQPVLAMIDGHVLAIANDFEDNFGSVANPNSKGANFVVVRNDALDCYQLYVHFQKGSIAVGPGDMVSPGKVLGLVGNSGSSSEPHLQVGISRRDANGFLRSLPMSFQKIVDGANKTVSGAPVDGQTYSQP
jgi:hypothetical protein